MGFSDRLPAKLWHHVFRYLDGASLLAVAEADPKLQPVALDPELLRSVSFLPDINEVTLGKFFTGKGNENRHHVRALRFTNCVALRSQALLSCAMACESLKELYVVSCAVDPAQLFKLLPQKMRQLELLEWSLLEDRFYWSWLQDATSELGACSDLVLARSLRSMYVEVVATPQNVYLMELIFNRCPELLHLHVHAIRKDAVCESTLGLLAEIMRPRPGLEKFTYTSERIPKPGNQAPESSNRNAGPRRFEPDGPVWGNVNYRLAPEANVSFVTLTDILDQKTSLRDVRQAIVAVESNTQANCHLLAASSKPDFFKDVRCLTLALFPPRDVLFPQAPTANRKYQFPLHMLFKKSVSAITELNLTAFHFSSDSDGSYIVGSALRLLRELAISPCGVNHPDSVMFLAHGCVFLEVLDVGTEQYSPSTSPCDNCRLPLLFTERCFECLSRRTRLRRLSIDESATLISLAFLRECRVNELRLPTDARMYKGLGKLLSANPFLSVLTIEDPGLALGQGPLAQELAEVHTLRRVCVLSGAPTIDSVASLFMEIIEVILPKLEILHVHYLDVRRIPQTATWIRQRRMVLTRMMHSRLCQSQGVYCYLQPCLGCYTSTFIGLARPRNRN